MSIFFRWQPDYVAPEVVLDPEVRRFWRRFGVRLLAVCLLLTLSAPTPAAADAPSGGSRVITNIDEFFSSTFTKSNPSTSPFRLQGQLLCVDPEWNQFFLFDGQRAHYLNPNGFRGSYRTADVIELSGVRFARDGSISNVAVRTIAHRALPPAKTIRLSQIKEAQDQWIATSGRVRSADLSRGRLALQVRTENQSCLALVMGGTPKLDCKDFIGSNIKIRGIVVDTAQEVARMMVPGPEEVIILERAPVHPSVIEVASIDSLLTRSLDTWTNQMVRISGSVVAARPGESLTLKDPTGTLLAQVAQSTVVHPSDRLDVWGYLTLEPGGPVLDDAYFEVVHPVLQHTSAIATGGSEAAGPASLLTNVHQVIRLDRAQAVSGLPVRLEGVITYADPSYGNTFLQDAFDAIYVQMADAAIQSGTRVLLTGRTDAGQFAPVIIMEKAQVLAQTSLPQPVKVDVDDLADGHLDSHWVELEGVVRRIRMENGHAYLDCVSTSGKFSALIPGLDSPPANLIDCRVAVSGACGSKLNPRGQVSGILLHVPSVAHIRVIEASSVDPFLAPAMPIATVATFSPERLSGKRVKLSGIVTLLLPGQGFFMQDASGGIRVQAEGAETLARGDRVEVLGFPGLGEYSPRLEEALFLRVQSEAVPTPVLTTPLHVLNYGTNDCMLVETEAELLQAVPRSAQPRLVLQDGAVIFTASLLGGVSFGDLTTLRPGSRLRLQGICTIQGSDEHEPQVFRLLLPNPDCVQLVWAPPSWTSRHTLTAAAGAGLLMLLVVGWIALLRRQVRRQTETIRKEQLFVRSLVESLPQNILRKDLQGRFTFANQFFCRTVGRPMEEILGKTDADLYPPELATKFRQDDAQVIKNGKLFATVEENLSPAGDQTWVEVIKTPLYDAGNRPSGLQVIFWDVTPRKQAEAQLQEAHQRLIEISRQAGMADVATGVLHNVGNVLNSVNVSARLLTERLDASRVTNLAKLSVLLQEHDGDLAVFLTQDARGKQVPSYLQNLTEHLLEERNWLLNEIKSLGRNIDHIKNIVSMQQSYAKVSGVAETVQPADLAEDALQINASALARHHIEIVRDFHPDVPAITVDKHKVLQVLINVIRNAKYACDDSKSADKQVRVSVFNGDGRVKIAVADNGIGIAPENLTRIFNLGFTTRIKGHGFGLHSGALAAKEMGGKLTAHSEGIDHGAVFTLELPLSQPPSN